MKEQRKIYRGDVYFAHLRDLDEYANDKVGKVGVTEMKKTRPVVIIQNNINNQFSSNVIVACVTSSPKKIAKFKEKGSPAQMLIQLDKESLVMFDSIMTVSKSRLGDKIGELSSEETVKMNSAISKSLGLVWIS